MHVLYNCKGEVVAKYRTEKGLTIGISKRKYALWAILIYYTEYEN